MNDQSITFLALGGEEDVTRNMYLYEYNNQILIVDCGLGFPDETMLGVDLLLPDISYLLEVIRKNGKKIIGMVLTHGHEDHIGGLPFILPQLPQFPIYASPFTAALANEKLTEFHLPASIQVVKFDDKEVRLGDFTISFIRVTHSVPDSANIFIKTPAGNLFHGSDFKFDLTPADGRRSDFIKMVQCAKEGVLALMSDCLGSERSGHTPSEESLGINLEREMRDCTGKFFVTTYSSNISRVNQIVKAAENVNRKVCFVGRSVVKVKQIAERMGYLHMRPGTEVQIADLPKFKNNQIVLVVAGSQGQENSALTRIADGEHKDIRLDPFDVVVFSSDPIPGNEVAINTLVDMISKNGAKAVHSQEAGKFHVSGHGSAGDHQLLIALTQPKYLVPISGTYRHMVDYRTLSQKMGYQRNQIFLVENGQEVLLNRNSARLGKKMNINNVYVDRVSGEEVEHFVVRDRERLGSEGIVVVMAEIAATDGQLVDKPEILVRGSSLTDTKVIASSLMQELEKALANNRGQVTNWGHVRRLIGDTASRHLFRKFRSRPLVLPVVIEV
jgi:ribonuclease J